ncbi:MAG: cation transporter [Candidatus Bathyarchaeota archaeon]|nr:cation transporter [Candidatus Bathyarchaeota archaeon]
MTSKTRSLKNKALLLVWIGEIWNILEATIALWSALIASSVALFAFGVDSLIEIFAGAVLIWRFSKGKKDESSTERKALKLIGATFFLLSGIILLQSTATFLGYFSRPQQSVVGILITISSAIIMTILFVFKSGIAKKLNSKALKAEAYQSLICDLQDLIIIVGLGLNILFGWWWADPLMAVMLIPFLIKEGFESFEIKQE